LPRWDRISRLDFPEERHVDQVVVEHGTAPLDDLYLALKPHSRNLGAVDHSALIGDGDVFPGTNANGRFRLYRIGDAVASRNIHAGIYDALRYGIRW
jgi:N-methyl-L-proline demethylase